MKKFLVLLFGLMISMVTIFTSGCVIGEEKEDSIEVWRLYQETLLCNQENVEDGLCSSSDLGQYITYDFSNIKISYDFDDDGTIESINLSAYCGLNNGKIRFYTGFDIEDGGSDTSTLPTMIPEGIFYCSLEDLDYQLNGNTLTVTEDGLSESLGYSQSGNTMTWTNLEDPNEKVTLLKTSITSPTEDCEDSSEDKISDTLAAGNRTQNISLTKKSAVKLMNRLVKTKQHSEF